MIKYKKKAEFLTPGFTYLFEWDDGSKFEGKYIRQNSQNKSVYLFRSISRDDAAPVYTPEDESLEACVWINSNSWNNIKEVLEVDKPDFVKPVFDKREEFAAALVFDALPMHGMDFCNKCGQEGEKIRTAYVCKKHGVYAGF